MDQSNQLRRYLWILKEWMWVLVLVPALVAFATYVISSRRAPTYQASTTLLLAEAPSTTSGSDYQAIMTSERRTQTFSQLIVTKPILEAVVEKLQLPVKAGTLKSWVTVQPIRNTQLLRIQVTDGDSVRAAQIANTLAEIFAEQTQQLQMSRYAAVEKTVREQIAAVENQIQQTNAKLTALPNGENASHSDKLTRNQLETSLVEDRRRHTDLLQTLEQLGLAQAQTTSNLVQVEPALAPFNPVGPRVHLNTILAALLSLLGVLGLLGVREAFDDSIKNVNQVTTQTGLPVLGLISRAAKPDRAQPLVVAHPHSPHAEAFRALRTHVQAIKKDQQLGTVLVTGALPNEGKTIVATNLAVVMAQTDNRVVLVDADLRRPAVHSQFGLTNRSGVTELLRQPDMDVEAVEASLRATPTHNAVVLPAGEQPRNPSELVGSPQMVELLDRLQARADLVVVDAPPINLVTDGVILAQHMEGVLFVARYGVSKLSACQEALEQLRQVGANVLGIVITDIPSNLGYKTMYQRYYGYDHSDPGNGGDSGGQASRRRKLLPRGTRVEPELDGRA